MNFFFFHFLGGGVRFKFLEGRALDVLAIIYV